MDTYINVDVSHGVELNVLYKGKTIRKQVLKDKSESNKNE